MTKPLLTRARDYFRTPTRPREPAQDNAYTRIYDRALSTSHRARDARRAAETALFCARKQLEADRAGEVIAAF